MNEAEEASRLVYIMGRGHSGTTFLDVLLGSAPGVASFGEVLSGLNRGLDEPCSCGVSVGECSSWKAIMRSYRERFGAELVDDGAWLFAVSDIRRFPSAWSSDFATHDVWGPYTTRNRQLVDVLGTCTAVEVVVDSNKEYTRALAILRGMPTARVIHLHRDPVSVAGSHYYRQMRGMPFKFLKREFQPGRLRMLSMMTIGMGWTVGVLLGYSLARRFRERVLHVSYEQLCDHPATELARIGEFIGMDLTSVIDGVTDGKAFNVGHNIGGNELRHGGTFTFVPNASGRRRLPMIYRAVVRAITAPASLLRRRLIDS